MNNYKHVQGLKGRWIIVCDNAHTGRPLTVTHVEVTELADHHTCDTQTTITCKRASEVNISQGSSARRAYNPNKKHFILMYLQNL